MSYRYREHRYDSDRSEDEAIEPPRRPSPGKITLTSRLAPVQRRQREPAAARDSERVARIAASGVSGGGRPLPHRDVIQRAFGRHDVSGVSAHIGGEAAAAAERIGAEAYATGASVAFRGAPDLHTAAHEAAHVIQQRAGVTLSGGVGERGDAYERHADQVADRVVAGLSAEDLLDAMKGGLGGAGPAIQKKESEGGGKDEDEDEELAREDFRRRIFDLREPLQELKDKVFDLLGIVERSEGRAVNPDVDALSTEINDMVREHIRLRLAAESASLEELEERVGALEALLPNMQEEMAKYEPFLAYHASLKIDELRAIASMVEPMEIEAQVAENDLERKKQKVEALRGAIENHEIQARINLGINMVGTMLSADPSGLVSGGYGALVMAINGPDPLAAAGAATSGVSFANVVGKAGDTAASSATAIGFIAGSIGMLRQAKQDQEKQAALHAKLERALGDLQAASQRLHDLMVALQAKMLEAESAAAGANSAYDNYQAGF